MNTVVCERCVVIPDVHQDAQWVERIFEWEGVAGSRDLVVFLGDYFDTRRSADEVASAGEMCEFLLRMREMLGERVIFLLGNHDIQYWEAKAAYDEDLIAGFLFNKCGVAFSHLIARAVAKGLPEDFWEEARLFVRVNGWLLSHAGLAARFWPAAASVEASLNVLDRECAEALASMHRGPQRLLEAGVCRGGFAEVGGITWLDWNVEFTDGLPLPQLVGHTGDFVAGARRKGRSWCIDGCQTCYGVLAGGKLEVREA